LLDLPFRMMTPLGRPDNAQDVMITLTAIDTLSECYSHGFSGHGGSVAWTAMMLWTHELCDRFMSLLVQRSPAALIVLAHWLPLVRNAEQYFWFMTGTSAMIMQQLKDDLPQRPEVLDLVQDTI
jgi:hypothetical protein